MQIKQSKIDRLSSSSAIYLARMRDDRLISIQIAAMPQQK